MSDFLTINDLQQVESDIEDAISAYRDRMGDDERIRSTSGFGGLLVYIYGQVFRTYKTTNKGFQNTIVSLDDINLLDSLFYIYIGICSRFDRIPTMNGYCTMLGIGYKTLYNYKEGRTRNNDNRVTAIAKWFAICENFLVDRTIDGNSIGSMFILKSNYQYRDSAPVQEIAITTQQRTSKEELADKYGGDKPLLDDPFSEN